MPGSSTIRFLLDGELIELSDVEPTRTVLQFLREDLRRTGTKEGCAEGDCGACTVVVAEVDCSGKDVTLQAINSCIQFLPTLDGKELITVESLSAANGTMHPVQRAMIDKHGAQCGFCTPGFVMSLLALYKTNAKPSRRDIDDALAGNLCRCTGYRPIIAAANAMYELEGDGWLAKPCGKGKPEGERLQALTALRREESLSLTSAKGRFLAPRTCEEFAELLGEHPDATILAGGTDVGLWVTKQHRDLDTIIYTGRVGELREVETTDTHIEIGAAVTLADAAATIVGHYPHLDELFRRFASPPIRNAGTLGGNVANGSPIGDSMPALLAAGATLVLRSSDGSREVALGDFYVDYMVNDLKAGEFLQAIRVPLPAAAAELCSYKVSKRFDQDISAVCGAFFLARDGGTISSARVAFGGLAAIVKRAPQCETALVGREWSESTITDAADALAEDFRPISDMRASAAYRLRVAQNMLRRWYLESDGAVTERVYTYGRER
jgi:xanthine dehydrogenase small subunit